MLTAGLRLALPKHHFWILKSILLLKQEFTYNARVLMCEGPFVLKHIKIDILICAYLHSIQLSGYT
jgi:hypothetical protein